MKEKIMACVIFAVTIGFVTVNTVILDIKISETLDNVHALELSDMDINTARSALEDIYNDFKKKELYISLTVNHEDLTNIENCFAEMIGYLMAEKADDASVVKYRLIDSLEHLRRLSGVNIDAII